MINYRMSIGLPSVEDAKYLRAHVNMFETYGLKKDDYISPLEFKRNGVFGFLQYHEELNVFDSSRFVIESCTDGLQVVGESGNFFRKRQGVFLIVCSVFLENVENASAEAQKKISPFVGHVKSIFGINVAWRMISNCIENLSTHEKSYSGSMIKHPAFNGDTLVTEENKALFVMLISALESRSGDEVHRFELSGHILDSATTETNASFAFLKYWMAIEVLLDLKGKKEVASIYRHLSGRCGVSSNKTPLRVLTWGGASLPIGELFGLRSRIVHSGYLGDVPESILGFMRALYFDMCLELYGVKAETRSLAYIKTNDVMGDVKKLLSNI